MNHLIIKEVQSVPASLQNAISIIKLQLPDKPMVIALISLICFSQADTRTETAMHDLTILEYQPYHGLGNS